MTEQGSLQWHAGTVWLVWPGGGRWESNEVIHSSAISQILAESPFAFLPTADPDPSYGESFLTTYGELGAPFGYVVPIYDRKSANDPVNMRRLAQASLIYIGGGDTHKLIATLDGTGSVDAIAAAYEAGAVIVGASAGAILLAKWGVTSDGELVLGWGWLADTIVVPHYTPERAGEVKAALQAHPDALALGIPDNIALALGPDGQVDTWSETLEQVTVTLGSKFGR